MFVQGFLFAFGVWQLLNSLIAWGLFNTIANFVFFIVNLFNLRNFYQLYAKRKIN